MNAIYFLFIIITSSWLVCDGVHVSTGLVCFKMCKHKDMRMQETNCTTQTAYYPLQHKVVHAWYTYK